MTKAQSLAAAVATAEEIGRKLVESFASADPDEEALDLAGDAFAAAVALVFDLGAWELARSLSNTTWRNCAIASQIGTHAQVAFAGRYGRQPIGFDSAPGFAFTEGRPT